MDDKVIPFQSNDERMNAAIEAARKTPPKFFEAFVAKNPNQKSFLLKVRFEAEGKSEHIWMADINASVFPLEGTVANEPKIPGMKFMARATFHPTQITDWMYIEDGYVIGGFTTYLIRSNLTPPQRADYDAKAPYKFRN
jgi:uncharacterized protein YegJ (DUF2314 family)